MTCKHERFTIVYTTSLANPKNAVNGKARKSRTRKSQLACDMVARMEFCTDNSRAMTCGRRRIRR